MDSSKQADVPKYFNGVWSWNEKNEELVFQSYYEKLLIAEQYNKTAGYKFLKTMNILDEMIFRQEFQRTDQTYDADVIVLQDIINLVLYLSPSEIITKKLIYFINTKAARRFLHALIIYMEHYLKIVEYLLIRRDEISGNMARMQSIESIKIKQILSAHLSQYRLLLARAYSTILLGEGSMKAYHHYRASLHISKTTADRFFHESFLAISVQVTWIAMHRHSYDVIEMEIGRLFRSEHFSLNIQDFIKFSEAERNMLYGKNYRRVNYRTQNSPIIQEISNVSAIDLPILWIGEHKYRGTDLRIIDLEMEFIVPSSQLVLINKTHGILGHPKILYDIMLQLDWSMVRKRNYSENYDPYNIVKQPRLQIPQLNEELLRKQSKNYDAYYKIRQIDEHLDKAMIDKWIERDKTVEYFKTKGMLTDVIVKCKEVLKEEEVKVLNIEVITQLFRLRAKKLKKQRFLSI